MVNKALSMNFRGSGFGLLTWTVQLGRMPDDAKVESPEEEDDEEEENEEEEEEEECCRGVGRKGYL